MSKPQVNLMRFHGVFAPISKVRGEVVKSKRGRRTTPISTPAQRSKRLGQGGEWLSRCGLFTRHGIGWDLAIFDWPDRFAIAAIEREHQTLFGDLMAGITSRAVG